MWFIFSFKSEDLEFGFFYFKKSENINSGIPFNYFLIDKRNNGVINFFVNDIIDSNGYVYFSYIDGELDYDFCYKNPNLKLAKINKSTYKIEEIPIEPNKRIFHSISKVQESDKEWLSNISNKCNQ